MQTLLSAFFWHTIRYLNHDGILLHVRIIPMKFTEDAYKLLVLAAVIKNNNLGIKINVQQKQTHEILFL